MSKEELSPGTLDVVLDARPTPPPPRLAGGANDLRLTFENGALAGQSFEFQGPRRVLLGRSKECDIELFESRVSRQHCVLTLEGATAHVKDLGSANGTRLNGAPVGLTLVKTGDVLDLAGTKVRIELGAADHGTVALMRGPTEVVPCVRRLRDPALRIRIPGYEIGPVLGEGATSAVFEARGKGGELVAIKVHKIGSSVFPEDRERFVREAETASALVHPNIVRVLDHGEAEERLYIVMEFVRGETVKARLQRLGRIPLPVALHTARQIASALGHAARHGIVHRDVKPDNILVQEDGVAKLVDFGLAKSLLSAGRSGVTRMGDVLGTLQYMPPEQLDSSVTADHRADIYSLGATLYHMIAGETPFSAKTNFGYFHKILFEEPPILGLLSRDVPPIVSAMVSKCLRKRPDERYQSADEIVKLTTTLLASGEQRTTAF
ncbi:MAG TPA: FHA domain-containing serine/threonine-protein kinase [Planctomycetota bacterium]|nr:FHA domain-containing serine/threonine-protein kinase [Planctomycetota bacterium]